MHGAQFDTYTVSKKSSLDYPLSLMSIITTKGTIYHQLYHIKAV